MKKILLITKKQKTKHYALVDDVDYEWIRDLTSSWLLNSHGYAHNDRLGYLHQLIILAKNNFTRPDKELICDHINNNPLDNRRENLRLATPTQSSWNRRKKRTSKNKFIGVKKKYSVYKLKNGEKRRSYNKKFCVMIRINKKDEYIGFYDTEIEAARAYDKKALETRGEFAKLNFPVNKH